MIEQMFVIIITVFLLAYAGMYDYMHKKIELWVVLLFFALGFAYALFNGDLIVSISLLVLSIFLWGLPVLFKSFGVGDFLLFLGLSLFMTSWENFWTFYGVFLFVWIAWTFIMLIKESEKITSKLFYNFEYPLIPAVAFAFYIWMVIV